MFVINPCADWLGDTQKSQLVWQSRLRLFAARQDDQSVVCALICRSYARWGHNIQFVVVSVHCGCLLFSVLCAVKSYSCLFFHSCLQIVGTYLAETTPTTNSTPHTTHPLHIIGFRVCLSVFSYVFRVCVFAFVFFFFARIRDEIKIPHTCSSERKPRECVLLWFRHCVLAYSYLVAINRKCQVCLDDDRLCRCTHYAWMIPNCINNWTTRDRNAIHPSESEFDRSQCKVKHSTCGEWMIRRRIRCCREVRLTHTVYSMIFMRTSQIRR